MTDGKENPQITTPAPGITCLRAPNPGPLTGEGTNTYIIGASQVWIVDPGPPDAVHLDAIERLVDRRPVHGVVVTHAHLDHSAAAPTLARRLGSETYGFAPDLPPTGDFGGGEGRDLNFAPDRVIADGDVLDTDVGPMTALWTPGHFPTHLCFALPDAILSADLVMGWSTTLISPPDGDLRAFYASCARLLEHDTALYLPGHGAPIQDGPARVRELLAHRQARTDQILNALATGPLTIAELVERNYADTPRHLWPAAGRNVLAHLLALEADAKVTTGGTDPRVSKFRLAT